MAFLGGIGKALGLGSTGQVLSGLGNIGAGLSGVGAIGTGIQQATGGTNQGQGVAYSQATQTFPQETQSSSTQAGMGLALGTGSLVGVGQQLGRGFGQLFGKAPPGLVGLGTGVAGSVAVDAVTSMMGGMGGDIRVTRKQQKMVKDLVMIVGIESAASILGLSVGEVALIMTKKFRATGKGITAAQLRTAQRVNNRIVHMHDKLKAAYGGATRRTTARRASSTRVTQIKN